MKIIDNKIKYYSLLMTYDDTSVVDNYLLPIGYHFAFFDDNIDDWIRIHLESLEFTSYERGKKIFHDFYDYFIDELEKRCFFIVEDSTNKKIGTATISLLEKSEFGYDAVIDWLAISRDYQGRGLSKPLISRAISLAFELGHNKILLHTQTTTWLAAKLYLDFGFSPLVLEDDYGFRILKTITNHKKLEMFKILDIKDIYDYRIVQIEKILKELFMDDDFHYEVWYQNGEHKVYTYHNGITQTFIYYDVSGTIKLEEVDNV